MINEAASQLNSKEFHHQACLHSYMTIFFSMSELLKQTRMPQDNFTVLESRSTKHDLNTYEIRNRYENAVLYIVGRNIA